MKEYALLRKFTVFCGIKRSPSKLYGLLRNNAVFCQSIRSIAKVNGMIRKYTDLSESIRSFEHLGFFEAVYFFNFEDRILSATEVLQTEKFLQKDRLLY